MRIPSSVDCLEMLACMQMPSHILDHSRLVHRVALLLTDELAVAGVVLNRPLVQAAALLHDITKSRSFQTKENHALSGGEYLTALGYPEVGDIVRQHIVLDDYDSHGRRPVEAEVVNYADKRVLHDHIVALDDRMAYILERYARSADRRMELETVWHQTIRLENRLFAYLTFSPPQLAQQLSREPEPSAAGESIPHP